MPVSTGFSIDKLKTGHSVGRVIESIPNVENLAPTTSALKVKNSLHHIAIARDHFC
jgi:hypothetical protein